MRSVEETTARVMAIVHIGQEPPPEDPAGLPRYREAKDIAARLVEVTGMSFLRKMRCMPELYRRTEEFYKKYPPVSS